MPSLRQKMRKPNPICGNFASSPLSAADAHALLLSRLSEPRFRALYIAVARLFANELVGQTALMRKAESLPGGGERNRIAREVSLVGKWAPTPGALHDRVTNISTAIAILLYHGGAMSSLSRPIVTSIAVSTEDAYVLRSFYQRWVLTPLRAVARVPEPLMAVRRWGDVSYKHVPSKCMHINGKHFIKHDTERFEGYLDSVAEGKAKISGATLLPHELLGKALAPLNLEYREGKPSKPSLGSVLRARIAKREAQVIDAQWDAIIAQLRGAGMLDNCLALCDVSGLDGRHLLALRAGDATHPAGLGALDDARAARQAALRERLRDVLVGSRARHDPGGRGAGGEGDGGQPVGRYHGPARGVRAPAAPAGSEAPRAA